MAEMKPFEAIMRFEPNGTRYTDDGVEVCVKASKVQDLVRCKDCKYCYAEGFVNVRNVCEKHYDFGNVDDDWFCADGARKENEDGQDER